MTAWIISFNRQYGIDKYGKEAFLTALYENNNVHNLQGGAPVTNELNAAYCRGKLTFKAMCTLPVNEFPQLARSTNFWLPVQSYYSIHGIGLAAMIALNITPPQSHMTFLASLSSLLHDYFPVPFCGLCVGGPETIEFTFRDLSTTMDRVFRQSQLANPENIEDLETFVRKSLSTIREVFLNRRFEEKRNNERKKRLTRKAKAQCCQNEHSTSVCDLLYRMRLRSNYDNPDMYLFAPTTQESAARSYQELKSLTELLIAGFNTLIERRIGRRQANKLRKWIE